MELLDPTELWGKTKQKLENKHLILVCNAKSSPHSVENEGTFYMDTEYFSDDEFEQVVSMFGSVGMPMDIFTYEDDFLLYVMEKQPKDLIVYNSAQSGTGAGRKSLIPAFCNLHGITCTGSNAYVVSLCRQKYHVNQILSRSGIRVPATWLYFDGWIMNRHPDSGCHIILKPVYESASIGIDDTSIQLYSSDTDDLAQQRMELHRQPIIAQKFITGYEVEVPLVCVKRAIYKLPPVGIAIQKKHDLGSEILNYERVYFDHYSFYNFSNERPDLCDDLCDCAATVARILGMEGLCRVDFRIESDGVFYVTDVSTNPHFISHSSVNHSFQTLGLSSNDIAKTILSATILK